MFCAKCYADLSPVQGDRCAKCGRLFDRANPRTFLARPFPGRWDLVGTFVVTTMFAAGVAFVVAFHQLARTSGH